SRGLLGNWRNCLRFADILTTSPQSLSVQTATISFPRAATEVLGSGARAAFLPSSRTCLVQMAVRSSTLIGLSRFPVKALGEKTFFLCGFCLPSLVQVCHNRFVPPRFETTFISHSPAREVGGTFIMSINA